MLFSRAYRYPIQKRADFDTYVRNDNNPASFSPSFRPLRGLHSSVHGAVLFPRFYLAHFCKVPPSAFLPHRFPSSLSEENKNDVSLSVSRQIIFVPRNLSSPAASAVTRQVTRIPSPLCVNQFVAHQCAPHLHSGTPPDTRLESPVANGRVCSAANTSASVKTVTGERGAALCCGMPSVSHRMAVAQASSRSLVCVDRAVRRLPEDGSIRLTYRIEARLYK